MITTIPSSQRCQRPFICSILRLLVQFVGWSEDCEFGSSYRDCDFLVTESVLSVERELREQDRECVYMTVRPGQTASQDRQKHGPYQGQHTGTHRRRSREQSGAGETVMYDKKYAMDSDYREYTHYRDRPRGEFLTRGAALSSQQSVASAVGRGQPEPVYGQVPGPGPVQARAHPAYVGQPGATQAGQHPGHGSRLGRNISSEKIAMSRNPTILRKSMEKLIIFVLFHFIELTLS